MIGIDSLSKEEIELLMRYATCNMSMRQTSAATYYDKRTIAKKLLQISNKTKMNVWRFWDLHDLMNELEKAGRLKHGEHSR